MKKKISLEVEMVTAAIEGTSDRPGEPWDTSIPKIIVGDLEAIGIEREYSAVR